jgi:hypothetical protein
MNRFSCILILGISVCMAAANAQTMGNPGFEKMKTLAGNWTGTADGKAGSTSIRVVSNGTAIEETMNSADDTQMVSMFTPVGNRLAMTHYCSMGNQPHLETGPIAAGDTKYSFVYKDATNLASASDPHISHLTIQLGDNDHFTETWTFTEGGKDTTMTLQLTRQK